MKGVSVIANRYKEAFKKVLVRMKQDEIMSIIKNNEFLLLFGTVQDSSRSFYRSKTVL